MPAHKEQIQYINVQPCTSANSAFSSLRFLYIPLHIHLPHQEILVITTQRLRYLAPHQYAERQNVATSAFLQRRSLVSRPLQVKAVGTSLVRVRCAQTTYIYFGQYVTSQAASGSDAKTNGSEARKKCTVVIKNSHSHGRYTIHWMNLTWHSVTTCVHAEFATPSVRVRCECDANARRCDKSTEYRGPQDWNLREPRESTKMSPLMHRSSQLGPRSW